MQFLAVTVLLLAVSQIHCGSKDFQRAVLDEHNKHRGTHNAGPLTLDDKLSKNASLTAKKAADSGSFESISPGESVFVSCATFKREVTGKEVTDAWYGEVCNPSFDFKDPDNEKTRGFSQLVWKDTTRIGVGKAIGHGKDGEICVYIVGVYRPPGNLVGFFDENVEIGTFDKDEYCSQDEEDAEEGEEDEAEENEEQKGKQGRKVEKRKEEQTEESELKSSVNKKTKKKKTKK